MTPLPEQISLLEVPRTLRRGGDHDTVARCDVLRRVGDTRHLMASTGERIARWCDPLVARLVAQVGFGRIASIGHASAFSVALAAIHYQGRPHVSRAALDNFFSVADLLGEELGMPCGEGLLATPSSLSYLVRSEHIEVVRDVIRAEYQRTVGESTDRGVLYRAATAANCGVNAVNDALHSVTARAHRLRVETNLLPVVRRSRDEFIATWPDELVHPVEVYALQVATALEACGNRDEWLAVATLVASSCRGGESRPRRSEVAEHFGGSLVMCIPAVIGKTGHATTIMAPSVVAALGIRADMYPVTAGSRLRAQADDATRAAIETMHHANDLLIARGLPPFPARFGLSYAFRHRNALLPAEIHAPHDAAIAVNAMLTHSRGRNADDEYDKPTYSAYAKGLAAFFEKIDSLTTSHDLRPPLSTLRPWKELKRTRVTSALPTPDVWPLVRAVFEDVGLLGVFYGLIGPPGTWEDLVRVDVTDIDGRRSLLVSGLTQGHPVPGHVADAIEGFTDRRRNEARLQAARSLERVVLESVERRLEARFRDHHIEWPGPMLSAELFRSLRGQIVDGLGVSPGMRRALLGRSATGVPHYVPGSVEVVQLVDASLAPLAHALTGALAASPAGLRHRPA